MGTILCYDESSFFTIINGPEDDVSNSAYLDEEGFTIFGVTESYGIQGEDLFMWKLFSDGSMRYTVFGGTDDDDFFRSTQLLDGSYVIGKFFFFSFAGLIFFNKFHQTIAHYFLNYDELGYNSIFTKFSSDGTLQWSYHMWDSDDIYMTAFGARIFDLRPTVDGGFIASGRFEDWVGESRYYMLLAKFESDGTLEWMNKVQLYDDSIVKKSEIFSVQPMNERYIISGRVQIRDTLDRELLVASFFATNGSVEYARTITFTDDASEFSFFGTSICQSIDDDGDYFYVSGYIFTLGRHFVGKFFAENGTVDWIISLYGVSRVDSVDSRIFQTSDDDEEKGLVIAGYGSTLLPLLVKLSTVDGSVLWAKSYVPSTNPGSSRVESVLEMNDENGGYAIAGRLGGDAFFSIVRDWGWCGWSDYNIEDLNFNRFTPEVDFQYILVGQEMKNVTHNSTRYVFSDYSSKLLMTDRTQEILDIEYWEYLSRCYVECYGDLANETEVCSSHGECVGLDHCACDEGFTFEEDCSLTFCYDIPSNRTDSCGESGDCTELDVCYCTDNSYFSPEDEGCYGTCDEGMYIISHPEKFPGVFDSEDTHCVQYSSLEYTTKFTTVYSGDGRYFANSVLLAPDISDDELVDDDFGFIVCGTWDFGSTSGSVPFVSKFSNIGEIIWAKTFGFRDARGWDFSSDMTISCLHSTAASDDGFLVMGNSEDDSLQNVETKYIFLCKFDYFGELQFCSDIRVDGVFLESDAMIEVVGENGTYLITGRYNDTGDLYWTDKPPFNTFILKVSSDESDDPSVEWFRASQEIGFYKYNSILSLPDGGFVVVGDAGESSYDFFISVFNEDGSTRWGKLFEGENILPKTAYSYGPLPSPITQYQSNGTHEFIFLTGNQYFVFDSFLMKIDLGSGEVVWSLTFDSDELYMDYSYLCHFYSIVISEDQKHILATGRKYETDAAMGHDVVIARFSVEDGSLDWLSVMNTKGLTDSFGMRVLDVTQQWGGGYAVIGGYFGDSSILLSKVDGLGSGSCEPNEIYNLAWMLDDGVSMVSFDGYSIDEGWSAIIFEGTFTPEYEIVNYGDDVEILDVKMNLTKEVLCMDEFTCSGVVASDRDEVCSGHGVCLNSSDDGAECICEQMYMYSTNCDWECYGVDRRETDIVCSEGNGVCVGPGDCDCGGLYIGEKCQTVLCYGINATDTSLVCSGHGECVESNNCSCTVTPYGSYYGDRCENWDCGGVPSTQDATVCLGRGTCEAPNQCECDIPDGDFGYYGIDCEVQMGEILVRATPKLFVMMMEIKEVFLNDAQRYDIRLEERFDCRLIFNESSSELIDRLFFGGGGTNCLLSSMVEDTVVLDYSKFLKIDASHLSDEEIEEIIDEQSTWNAKIYEEDNIGVRIRPEMSDDDENDFTIRSFGGENEDSSDVDVTDFSQLCKENLWIGDTCAMVYECKEEDNDDLIQGYGIRSYMIGYMPDPTYSYFYYTKIYFPDEDACREGVEFQEYKTFSLVSCHGSSSFGDSFIVYERCKFDVLDIFFGVEVIPYFAGSTVPVLFCVVPCLILFCCIASVNGATFLSRKCSIWGISKLMKKGGKEEEEVGDDDDDQEDSPLSNKNDASDDCDDSDSDIGPETDDDDDDENEGGSPASGRQSSKDSDSDDDSGSSNAKSGSSSSSSEKKEEEEEAIRTRSILKKMYVGSLSFLEESSSSGEDDSEDGDESSEISGEEEEEEDDDSETRKILKKVYDKSLSFLEENEKEEKEEEEKKEEDYEKKGYKSEDEQTTALHHQVLFMKKKKSESDDDSSYYSHSSPQTSSDDHDSTESSKEQEEEEEEKSGFRFHPIKCLFCCCTCIFTPWCNRYVGGIWRSCIIVIAILFREGLALYLSSQEFLGTSDVDTTNQYYILLDSVMNTTYGIIGTTIVLYLIIHLIMIWVYVGKLHYDPLMFCVGYGSLKEFVYFRVFKSSVLSWLMCVNFFCFILKFRYLDSAEERMKELEDPMFYLLFLLPQSLLFFTLISVLRYNRGSSHSHRRKLNKLRCKEFLLGFPRVKVGIWQLAFSGTDEILEDFFQLLFFVTDDDSFTSLCEDDDDDDDEKDEEKEKDMKEKVEEVDDDEEEEIRALKEEEDEEKFKELMKRFQESDEYGHLMWEFFAGMKRSDVLYLKEFFFPSSKKDILMKKQSYWTVFHHYRVLTWKWFTTVFLFPFVCAFGYLK